MGPEPLAAGAPSNEQKVFLAECRHKGRHVITNWILLLGKSTASLNGRLDVLAG